MITERYGLKTFEDNDYADLVEYSKTMNKAIAEALDNNKGEKGEPGATGPAGGVNSVNDMQGDVTIDVATASANGLMSSNDKTKLNGIAAGANKTTVVNNLTSTSTTSALSANQGKILNDKITDLKPLCFEGNGELGGPMWWRIGQLGDWFGSLITISIENTTGYVATYHLNVGCIGGGGIVLEQIGTASVYGPKPFSKVRLVYAAEGAFLEFYTPQALGAVKIHVTVHSMKSRMCNFTILNEAGKVSNGYSTKQLEL